VEGEEYIREIDRSFSLLADATDGRLIGWTSLSVEELA